MKKSFFQIIILGSIFYFYSQDIFATTYQHGIIPSQFKEGYYSMGTETTYLNTNSNFNNSGSTESLPGGYSFSSMQSQIYGRLDSSDETSSFASLHLNYATSEDNIQKRSAFKISGLSIGTDYDLNFHSQYKIIPEIRGYFALEKFKSGADEILTSDGAHLVEIGTHVLTTLNEIKTHGFLSFTYRLDGFSSLMNYQVDGLYPTSLGEFGGGIRGFFSVLDDKYSNRPSERENQLFKANGSSYAFASVNPSQMNLFGCGKFGLNDSIDIYGGMDYTLLGANTAKVFALNIGFEYFFEPLEREKVYNPNEKFKDKEFISNDESVPNYIDEEIKTINRPKKEKKVIKRKSYRDSYDSPEVSKKFLEKESTSTSPIKSNKKKKKKRLQISF